MFETLILGTSKFITNSVSGTSTPLAIILVVIKTLISYFLNFYIVSSLSYGDILENIINDLNPAFLNFVCNYSAKVNELTKINVYVVSHISNISLIKSIFLPFSH